VMAERLTDGIEDETNKLLSLLYEAMHRAS
jgi:hypothetical protein